MIIYPVDHRIPPKPHWLQRKTKGFCSWCGERITKEQRTKPMACTWHLHCLEQYNSIWLWPLVRKIIYRRDQGQCQSCGTTDVRWDYEVDHIKPLWAWNPRDMSRLTKQNFNRYYAPWRHPNLQLLCPACHRDKTKADRMIWTKPIRNGK